ncbi:adenylate/guanylate cyclase domain-containing protein [Afifella sp. IM 167]|uniref:adenylate/guanylate cyclase domain-containing protein n=1 Tax=Afifella sp. IM 167 TaxID=2033586 RepID=UPI001CC93E3B|nr:adenylate/guanylate cyclase domain-containing protein [Afifella sp. IM 167]MBZ8133155.1 adenylate cyclase [Afifella sp. IM 167]
MSRVRQALPQSLQRQIDELDEKAEIRIGWAQLALITFFGSAYLLLPRAEGTAGFNFVPYALAGYAIFTMLRLILAYRRKLFAPLLVVSIVIDVALLTAIIFSYHIQYDEPAAFYLKAPTVLYFFLFIALRALRFDPTLLILTGALAVCAWLSLAGFAIFFDDRFVGITRNYVEYSSGNRVLIGAELDKVIVIAATTFLLAFALVRSRQLLVTAVRDHATVGNLSRFFAPEVAETVGSQDPDDLMPGTGATRDVAAVFIDIRRFTQIARELDPDDVMDLLTRYQTLMADAIQRFNGHIDKFLGDGILVTFGAVKPSESYAADALGACYAALAAAEVLDGEMGSGRGRAPLLVGCAAACGPAVVGVVGGKERLEHTVIGPPVNLAAKLEDANRAQGTAALTTRAMLEIAREQGFTPPGSIEMPGLCAVEGIAEPVDLVILAPAKTAPLPPPAAKTESAKDPALVVKRPSRST